MIRYQSLDRLLDHGYSISQHRERLNAPEARVGHELAQIFWDLLTPQNLPQWELRHGISRVDRAIYHLFNDHWNALLEKENLQIMPHETMTEMSVMQLSKNKNAAETQDDPGVRTAVKHLDTTSGRARAQRLHSSEGSGRTEPVSVHSSIVRRPQATTEVPPTCEQWKRKSWFALEPWVLTKNWTSSKEVSAPSSSTASSGTSNGWEWSTMSFTSCWTIWAGTLVRFRVYFKTSGPGFFQFACKPISSVERPACTAASRSVTRAECAVIPWSFDSASLIACSSPWKYFFKANLARLNWSLIGRQSISEGLAGVEITHPVVSVERLKLKNARASEQPSRVSKADMGNSELGSPSLPFDLCLPCNAEQAFIGQDELMRLHMNRVIKTMQSHHQTKRRAAWDSSASTTKCSMHPITSTAHSDLGQGQPHVLGPLPCPQL